MPHKIKKIEEMDFNANVNTSAFCALKIQKIIQKTMLNAPNIKLSIILIPLYISVS